VRCVLTFAPTQAKIVYQNEITIQNSLLKLMVQVNEEKKELSIKLDGCKEDLLDMQIAIIDMVQNYNYKEYGEGAVIPVYWMLNLLKATLPTPEQIAENRLSDRNKL
jgi:hypothetical protein